MFQINAPFGGGGGGVYFQNFEKRGAFIRGGRLIEVIRYIVYFLMMKYIFQ